MRVPTYAIVAIRQRLVNHSITAAQTKRMVQVRSVSSEPARMPWSIAFPIIHGPAIPIVEETAMSTTASSISFL